MKRNILNIGMATLLGAALVGPQIATADTISRLSVSPAKAVDYEALKASGKSPLKAIKREKATIPSQTSLFASGPQTLTRPAAQTSGKTERLMTRSAENPRGHLYGVVGSYAAMEYWNQAFFGELDTKTGGVTPFFRNANLLNGNDYDLQGGVVRNGVYYTPVVQGDDQIYWNSFDIATGQQLSQRLYFLDDWAYYAYSMTYDPVKDLIYCLSLDITNQSGNKFVVVDPNDDFKLVSETNLNTNGEFLGGLAYCPADGEVYVFGNYDNVYSVTPGTTSGSTSTLNNAGNIFADFTPVENNISSQVVYSPLDAAFIMIYRDYVNEQMRLIYIDPESWDITEGVVLGNSAYKNPYFMSLYCPDPYADAEAPEQPAVMASEVDKDALEGTVSFTAPAFTFAGVEIPASSQMSALLTIDGKTLFSGDMKPGDSKTVSFTGEEGDHKFVLNFTLNGQTSPDRSLNVWLGNDNPVAPSNLAISGNTLTWSAPGEKGAHDGYVDSADLTYDIYIDGKKQNAEPVKELSFTFDIPEVMSKSKIEVKAVSHDMESASATLTEIIGKALSLPVEMHPTADEANLFRLIDANKDGYAFETYDMYGTGGVDGFVLYLPNGIRANDWVIMPAVNCPSADHLYSLEFDLAPAQITTQENVDVYIGKMPTPEAMTTNIYKLEDTPVEADIQTIDFAVPEAGEWYIGFHLTSYNTNAGGIILSEFAVKSLDGKASSVPGDATDVTIRPAALGALEADIDVTLPTLDLVGNPLPADQKLSVASKTGNITASGEGLPGAKVTLHSAVPSNGKAVFSIVISNASGDGLTRRYSHYVGVDRPLAPVNVKSVVTPDNLSAVFTWDAPGNVGQNGGYVDSDNLSYDFYTVNGITYLQQGTTKEHEYTYTAPRTATQQFYRLGAIARNEVGESLNSTFVNEVLGTPYVVPVAENFPSTGWNYEPIYYNSYAPYTDGFWDSVSSVLAYGTNTRTDCSEGALVVYNTGSRPTQGELVLPKISTEQAKDVTVTVRFLDWLYSPTFHVYGVRYGDLEPRFIGTMTPEKCNPGLWVDAQFSLPEDFNDCPWIQLFIRADLSTEMKEFGFIDSYTVGQDVDYDLKLRGISGSSTGNVGETVDYTVTVLNAGHEYMTGSLNVRLLDKNGKGIASQAYSVARLKSNGTQDFKFPISFETNYLELSPLAIEATVTSPDDEVEANNTVTFPIEVKESIAPTVKDLTAAWDDTHSKAQLAWGTPNLEYGGYDGFEYLKSFEITEDLGLWRNVDLDKAPVFGLINGSTPVTWPGWDTPQAWLVINPAEIGQTGDERMGGCSGKQYIMARTPQFDENDETTMIQASDWLISPEVVGGTDVSFMYCAVTATYDEYVEIWYSSTDDTLGEEITAGPGGSVEGSTCGSFKYLRTFSKSGSDAWEEVSFTLPEDAKYFAFVYRSYDSLGAMIDDVNFTQKNPSIWEVDHYSVWRLIDGDWNTYECIANNVKGNSFVDETVGDRNATYYVAVSVKSGDHLYSAPRSNPARLYSTSVGEIGFTDKAVSGGKGQILIVGLNGQTVNIHTLDGKLVNTVVPDADRQVIAAEPGVYVATAGSATYKLIVK